MIDSTQAVAVRIQIDPPAGDKILNEPMSFIERLFVTMADGTEVEATAAELPRLAARFFARYLGCCDAYNTQLRIQYGGLACKRTRRTQPG